MCVRREREIFPPSGGRPFSPLPSCLLFLFLLHPLWLRGLGFNMWSLISSLTSVWPFLSKEKRGERYKKKKKGDFILFYFFSGSLLLFFYFDSLTAACPVFFSSALHYLPRLLLLLLLFLPLVNTHLKCRQPDRRIVYFFSLFTSSSSSAAAVPSCHEIQFFKRE